MRILRVGWKNLSTTYHWQGFQLHNLYNEDVEEGKIVLSVKYGKRRRLVSGTLHIEPYSCQYNGLSYDFYFRPNDPERLKRLKDEHNFKEAIRYFKKRENSQKLSS